jgi:hypothetical protein
MNEHVHGVVFKDKVNAPQKPRRPLGLAPGAEDVPLPLSALEGRSSDELASPATVQHVLEALDVAISLRTEIDNPLRVRLGRLEGDTFELRAELAEANTKIEALQAAHDKMAATVQALRLILPNKAEAKAQLAAEVKAEVRGQLIAMHAERIARRARQKAATP